MNPQINDPLVSVVIANYNGKQFLSRCLETVFNSTYKNIEVIVVDNGSVDNSLPETKAKFNDTRLKLIALEKNFGPAYARNRGIEIAQGKYIAFLDNDTETEKDWIEKPVQVMEEDEKIGVCQCKLLLLKDPQKLDYVGDYLSQFGFLVQKATANEIDKGQYDSNFEILSAKSAAMIVRKELIDKTGGFDEDYFIYVEETDLCWRGWLAGYKAIFVPESRVYHLFGGSALSLGNAKQNYFAKFHGTKNYITTLLKNLGTFNAIKIIPVHIALWAGLAFWVLIHKKTIDSKNIFKGIFWVFMNLGLILKKRRQIQSIRVVSDRELMPRIMKKQSFNYFYKKATTAQNVGLAHGFYRKTNK